MFPRSFAARSLMPVLVAGALLFAASGARAQGKTQSALQIGVTVVRACSMGTDTALAAALPAGPTRDAAVVRAARADLRRSCDAPVAEAARVTVVDARLLTSLPVAVHAQVNLDVLDVEF